MQFRSCSIVLVIVSTLSMAPPGAHGASGAPADRRVETSFEPKLLPGEVQAGCAERTYDVEAGLACAEAFRAWQAVYCASLDADLWAFPNGPAEIFRVAEQLRRDCELAHVCPVALSEPRQVPNADDAPLDDLEQQESAVASGQPHET